MLLSGFTRLQAAGGTSTGAGGLATEEAGTVSNSVFACARSRPLASPSARRHLMLSRARTAPSRGRPVFWLPACP